MTVWTRISLHIEGYTSVPRTVHLAVQNEVYPKEIYSILREYSNSRGSIESAPEMMGVLMELLDRAMVIHPDREEAVFEWHEQQYTISLVPEEGDGDVILTVENALGEIHSLPLHEWTEEYIGSVG